DYQSGDFPPMPMENATDAHTDAIKAQLANLRAQRKASLAKQKPSSPSPILPAEPLKHAGNGCAFDFDFGEPKAAHPHLPPRLARRVRCIGEEAAEHAPHAQKLKDLPQRLAERKRVRDGVKPCLPEPSAPHGFAALAQKPPKAGEGDKELKSDCVRRVERLAQQREQRRKDAAAAKAVRAEEAKEAEGRGGIESVDFLNGIQAYRRAHGLHTVAPWPKGQHVWTSTHGSSRIRVCVRKRPMLKASLLPIPPLGENKHLKATHGVERLRHDFDIISAPGGCGSLVVHEPRTKVDLTKAVDSHEFAFDAFFTEHDSNQAVYDATLSPLLAHALAGGSANVFAFGQTGSGKTCTMAGHGNPAASDGNAVGLYELATRDLMAAAGARGLGVQVSFFEVYRGKVLDLLRGRTKLEVLEDGSGHVTVVGLHKVVVDTPETMLRLVKQARLARASSQPNLHVLNLSYPSPPDRQKICAQWDAHQPMRYPLDLTRFWRYFAQSFPGLAKYVRASLCLFPSLQVGLFKQTGGGMPSGKLVLVDLVKRAADSTSKDRQTRAEGAEINKSLLCLKECIRSLDSGDSHTPFRGSKLTQVLRESFIGNAKTAMIATIAPGSSAAENTLNTLRYAQRVRDFSAKEKRPAHEPPRFGRRAQPAHNASPHPQPSSPRAAHLPSSPEAPPPPKPPAATPRGKIAGNQLGRRADTPSSSPPLGGIEESPQYPLNKPRAAGIRRRELAAPAATGSEALGITKDIW
ncbi:MAG: hypothetical protein SGPRY_007729, partial [Prymnesium sp.]